MDCEGEGEDAGDYCVWRSLLVGASVLWEGGREGRYLRRRGRR